MIHQPSSAEVATWPVWLCPMLKVSQGAAEVYRASSEKSTTGRDAPVCGPLNGEAGAQEQQRLEELQAKVPELEALYLSLLEAGLLEFVILVCPRRAARAHCVRRDMPRLSRPTVRFGSRHACLLSEGTPCKILPSGPTLISPQLLHTGRCGKNRWFGKVRCCTWCFSATTGTCTSWTELRFCQARADTRRSSSEKADVCQQAASGKRRRGAADIWIRDFGAVCSAVRQRPKVRKKLAAANAKARAGHWHSLFPRGGSEEVHPLAKSPQSHVSAD